MASLRRCSWLLLLLLVLVLLFCSTDVDARRRRRGHRRNHRRRHRRQQQHQAGWHSDDSGGGGVIGELEAEEEAEPGAGAWWNAGSLAREEFEDESADKPVAVPTDHSQAYMMLVLQWPESLCASEKRGCGSKRIHPYMTLHGLWGVDRSLESCRADYDGLKLGASELAGNLSSHWPSYFHNNNDGFWKHEYHKHGSCLYGTMAEYFGAALKLQANYTLLDILTPRDQSAPLSTYTNAIHQRLGVHPMVMCRTNWLSRRLPLPTRDDEAAVDAGYDADDESDSDSPATGGRHSEQLLVEIGLCFSQAGELRDCPPGGRIRRCKRGRDVMLPPLATFTTPWVEEN